MIGAKVAHYEITSHLGTGGMGEVYRATDSKLGRSVAIKLLPAAFAADPERLSRFRREAQLLASLNHPNIAHIYGLEESGDTRCIVMELIEGETLQARIKKGPIPVDEALTIAKQIAEALEAAHEKGVIHRDLKPGNVMMTDGGQVKVLDFGLAKAFEPSPDLRPPSPDGRGAGGEGLSNSPTMSMAATNAGMILGTAAYMSPEQASGKAVDKRADVWSFGVVLWEMLAGRGLFGGETVSHTLADVLRAPIEFSQLPAAIPGKVRDLLRRCLNRDVKKRMRDIGEARIAIDDAFEQLNSAPEPVAVSSRLSWLAAGVLAVLALALAGLVAWTFTSRPAPSPPAGAVRFTLAPPPGMALTSTRGFGAQLAVSPDGRYIAFVAADSGAVDGRLNSFLWVRAMGSLSAQKLDKTDGAQDPFWSPDSRNIGFFAEGKLKRISVSGGAAINLCDAEADEGGAWFQQVGADGKSEGVILFAPTGSSAIQRVPATGGVPTPVTKLAEGEGTHRYPQFLPDGKRFLYHVRGPKTGIYVQQIGSDQRTFLMETIGRARFAPPDFLLYMRDSTLLAQHVDWETLKPLGEPVSVADEVRTAGANARNAFSVSSTGLLAYRGGDTTTTQYRWYTRDGKPEGPGLAGDANNDAIEFSPDNKRAVFMRLSGNGNNQGLWLMEFPSGVISRLTSDKGNEQDPVWSPDSRRIAFVKNDASGGKRSIYQMLIGSGKATLVYEDARDLEAWTHDGLLLRSGSTVTLLPAPEENAALPITEKPRVLLDVKYAIDQFRISPDGKWVAYASAESGDPEVWVATFPDFNGRRKVSAGRAPSWRADGKELIFVAGVNDLLTVDVKPGAAFDTSPPKPLLRVTGAFLADTRVYFYAMTGDAKRFLIRERPNVGVGEVEPLYVILNWPALLK